MEHTSQFIKAYYNSFDSTEKNAEKIADKIANEVKQAYDAIYNRAISSQISIINAFLKENYITYIGEDIQKTSLKIQGDDKETSKNNFYYHYDELMVECFDAQDNFVDLANALQSLTCKTKLKKELQNNQTIFSKKLIDNARSNPVETNHWFPKSINEILKKLNKNEFDIHKIIIYMIYMAISNKEFYTGWFQLAVLAFRAHTPNCWNNCVYCYYLINHHNLIIYYKSKQKSEKIYWRSHCSNAYAAVMNLSVINLISSTFIQNDSSNFFDINFDTIVFFDNYFGNGNAFKSTFRQFIYSTQNGKCKNRIPRELFMKKIFHVGLVAFLTFLYGKYIDWQTKKDVAGFIETIEPHIKSAKFKWSLAVNCLCQPSPEEVLLLNALEKALTVHNDKQLLRLFPKTEKAVKEKAQNVKELISKVKKIRKAEQSEKKRQRALFEVIKKLVYECDEIEVDFSALHFSTNFKHNYDDGEYIIHFLNAYECCYLDFLRKDVYYIHEVENKNYESIRNSLKYRARNLNASIFDVYKNIVTAIESYYFSAQCSDKNLYTERDFLYALNTYAWCKLKTNLNIYLDNNNPADNTYSCDLIKSSKLFVACNILDNNCDFISEEEFLACAAMGVVEGYEHYNPEDVTNLLLMLLEKYCLQSDLSNSSHLELFSKPFVTFGAICILGLSHSYKKIVITRLCQEANKVVLAKNRKAQQTLIVLLNTLIIQPKVRLDSETSEKLLNTIFNRVLYPHQMLSIGRIEQHPFLKSILHKHKEMLSSPKITGNSLFPSPFYMYLYANEYAAIEKNKKDSNNCLRFKNEHVMLNRDFQFASVSDFYHSTILLEGVSWKITNTDILGNKQIIFDKEIFIQMTKICYNHWAEIDTSVATNNLLMLTWGSHLLLTAFCNLARENKFLSIDDEWDYEKLLVIAVNADLIQRTFNEGYQQFLERSVEDSSNSSSNVPEFWLISGALRYSSLLQTAKKRPKNIHFFGKESPDVKRYCEILQAEKKLESNYRFFMLLSRLLSYTNFFEVIDEEYNDINPKSNDLPDNITDLFLAYDNIEPYLKSIKPPKKD